jgi:hypothetical protein
VRWEACNIAPEAKKSAVYTLARWGPLWFDPGGVRITRFALSERRWEAGLTPTRPRMQSRIAGIFAAGTIQTTTTITTIPGEAM